MAHPWIGYARLSTDEQAQTNALRNQIERLKDCGADEIYYDIESGSKGDRDNLLKVLERVAKKEVAGVIATRWDRLTRDFSTYLYIKDKIRDSGVVLRLVDQGEVDLTTAAGELNADLQAIFAVHEVRELRQRIRKGFQKRRDRNGAWWNPPWGYSAINEKYEPNDTPLQWCGLVHRPANYLELYDKRDGSSDLVRISKAQIAREVFNVVLETRSPAETLNYLRKEYNLQRGCEFTPLEMQTFPISERGFKDWLANPIFSGHTAYLKYTSDVKRHQKDSEEWDVRLNTHSGILSADETDEIRDILSTNRKKTTAPGKTSYLTKLVVCGQCHTKCSLKRGGTEHYYGCQHAATTCSNRGCVHLWKIEKAIIQAITQKAWKVANEGSAIKSDTLIALEDKYQNLLGMGDLTSTPSLQKAKEDLQEQIHKEVNREHSVTMRMLMHPQARKINFWYALDQEERQIFYEKLVERVVINNKEASSVILKV